MIKIIEHINSSFEQEQAINDFIKREDIEIISIDNKVTFDNVCKNMVYTTFIHYRNREEEVYKLDKTFFKRPYSYEDFTTTCNNN